MTNRATTATAVQLRRPSSDVRRVRQAPGAVLDRRHRGRRHNLGLRRRLSQRTAIQQDSHNVILLMFVLIVAANTALMLVLHAVYSVSSAVV